MLHKYSKKHKDYLNSFCTDVDIIRDQNLNLWLVRTLYMGKLETNTASVCKKY